MKMQSVFRPGALKTIFLWILILMLSLVLFTSLIIPAQAAGSGWVEARTTVPSGFKENVIVTVVNSKTGDEFATRLMKENDYISFFSLPEGSYYFDGAFLENSDFRYDVTLTSGATTFDVSGQEDAAVLLSFNVTYNSAYSDGAKPTDPPVATEPQTETTAAAAETGTGKKPTASKPGSSSDAQLPADSEAMDPNITPSGSAQGTEASDSDTVSETGSQYTSQPGTTVNPNSPQHNVKDNAEQEDASAEIEKGEESLSLGLKLLYGLIATVVFGLIVFGLAYLYRRHLENS